MLESFWNVVLERVINIKLIICQPLTLSNNFLIM